MNKRTILHTISLLLATALLALSTVGCAVGMAEAVVFPVRQVEGEATYTFGSYTYQIFDDGTLMIVEYSGSEPDVVIPDTIDGKTVTAIGYAAFMSNGTLQSVKLNASLETIEPYAFAACTALTQVTFGKNLWRIGEFAFSETPWLVGKTEDFVIVSDGILLAYQGSSNDVVIPEEVKHISAAFAMHPSLVSVEMGENVLTVGDYAFSFIPTLRRVVLGPNVRSIGAYAFDGCTYLPSITIPDRVETIGDYAFNECNYLMDVRMGASVREIGQYAFKYCSRLLYLTLPATLERVAGYAFADCYSLSLVFYGGSETQWEALGLDGSNVSLKEAHTIYESNGGNR
ncbi:MAG: leucine-rich repeat protein [Clostridia bacterium]|nr:leucine-rich repeat protein [Clostridia bacterium]